MKPVYVVLLMGAAAIGGGLVVRYTGHSAPVAPTRPAPPTVVAPPIPPPTRMRPSDFVPVRSAPAEPPVAAPEKPSALSLPVRLDQPDRNPNTSPVVARTRVPPEPPAVIPLERSTVPRPPVPAPAPVQSAMVEPKEAVAFSQPAPQREPPPQPQANRVTLRPGMLVPVRITEALSSDRNVHGDVFTGTLDRPLIADGFVIAERGARVRGEVITSTHAGRGDGMAELILQLKEVLTSDGQHVPIVTQPWRKQGNFSSGEDPTDAGSGMVTRHPAVIKPATSIPFRLDQAAEITEKR